MIDGKKECVPSERNNRKVIFVIAVNLIFKLCDFSALSCSYCIV